VRTKTSSSSPDPHEAVSTKGAALGAAPDERRSGAERRRPLRVRSPHDETFLEAAADFVTRVWKKADQDQIFFLAGAISFNVLVAIIPLILASLGITGQILQRQVSNADKVLVEYVLGAIPDVSPAFEAEAHRLANDLLAASARITIVGLVLLVWVSTRLVGTLRAALKEVFDVGADRNIIMGKLFDMKIVVLGGSLFAVNVVFTFVADLVNNILTQASSQYLGVQPLHVLEAFYVRAIAVLGGWVMFLLVYRYLPYRRIHWSTAVVAASFTALVFELLKRAFSWYVANWAQYDNTYGNVANIVIFFLWVYYTAVIFVLGGEIGQVYALRRIRKRQKQRLV
jgi:membrane protein